MAELKDLSDIKASSLAELPRSAASSEKTVTNVDAAWEFLDANRDLDGVDYTVDELKALRRKVDWRIVPMMFCCYTMQFLDKVILNVSGLRSVLMCCATNWRLVRDRRRVAAAVAWVR